MSDKPPLMFRKQLGRLAPVNAAAQAAMESLGDGPVRVEIKSTRGNSRRNALYWACLSVAAPMLDEKAPGITANLLHKILKDRAGLVRVITLPSGEQIKDYDSISFHRMTEPERAQYIDWALKTLSSWLGCDVTELREEARREAA